MNASHIEPRILTNMAFWESPVWVQHTVSIHAHGARPDEIRALSPWSEAIRLFRRRRDYDVVVTMGARESLCYGLLCAAAGQPSRQIMTEVFLDAPRPRHLAWRMKTALFRLVARRALGILTNSSAEVDFIAARFRLPRERLRYVPMHTTIAEPAFAAESDGSVLAAGRTLRDYPALIRAAARISAPVHIICGHGDLAEQPLPDNVRVLRETPRDVYLELLRRCSVVALPLQPAERATGQVVMLEAMALGKPVVATRAPGVCDHIRNGETGLLVEPGDSDGLARAINRLLTDRDLAAQIARRALADIRAHAAFDTHAAAKLAAIRELWEQSRESPPAPD